jgi:hypothetical protein
MKSIILFFLIFFFQSIANANLLSDCQNITQQPLNELAELCPIGNNKTECNCEVQFSDDSDSLEAKLIKEPKKYSEIKGKIECDGEDKFCEFFDEEGNEISNGKLIETPDGIYVGDYDKKGRADGEGMFINENVIYIGKFSKNRMHYEGTLINENKMVLFEGKHKYGRMNNYNVNYNNFDLKNINKIIKYKNNDRKFRIQHIIRMNTGHNYDLQITAKNTWYPMKIYIMNNNISCMFDVDVIGQIEGGGDSDSGGSGDDGDGAC